MEMTLEVIVVPVSDVDRAKDFYAERLASTSTPTHSSAMSSGSSSSRRSDRDARSW